MSVNISGCFRDYALIEQIGWKSGRAVWITRAPLRYESPRVGAVTIPTDFITDLASVPRVAFAYWIAGGRGTRSAILHDFAYQFGYWFRSAGSMIRVSKAEADTEFRVSLLADPISGAGPIIASAMYAAVRIGGRGHWVNVKRTEDLNPEWAAEWLAGEAP